MNKFILEQLNKTSIIMPPYDNNTTELFIPKSGGTIQQSGALMVGDKKVIFIEDYIINEPENFTLSTNWNNGTKPPENRLAVQVLQINGKMIKVISRGVNTQIIWEGWLPQKAIKVIEDIN